MRRDAIRSTGIIGGAALVTQLISLARMKAVALILGPAGVGLVGLFYSLIQTASTVASLGISTAGARQMVEAGSEATEVARARRGVLAAAVFLGAAGTLVMFLARKPIAVQLLGHAEWEQEVGWLSIGVALLVASMAQNAVLTGLRRIGDLARVSIWSSLLGVAVAVPAILVWREKAIVPFVLIATGATLVVGTYYLSRVPSPKIGTIPLRQLVPQWKALAQVGLSVTIGTIAGSVGQLAVRSMVQRELGPVPLGHFQAAWVISISYIGLILTAMVADYYPRLTAALSDRDQAQEVVNHQMELALLLAGPLLVATVAFAPLIVTILYSSEFLPAAGLLRWQMVGDLLKITAWPLGYVLLASGRGPRFAIAEIVTALVLAGATALLLPRFGIEAPAMAYLLSYAVYLPLVFGLARRSIRFVPRGPTVEAVSLAALGLALTYGATLAGPYAGAAVGALIALGLAAFAAVRLRRGPPAGAGEPSR